MKIHLPHVIAHENTDTCTVREIRSFVIIVRVHVILNEYMYSVHHDVVTSTRVNNTFEDLRGVYGRYLGFEI